MCVTACSSAPVSRWVSMPWLKSRCVCDCSPCARVSGCEQAWVRVHLWLWRYSLMHCRPCFLCRLLLHSEQVAELEKEPGTKRCPLLLWHTVSLASLSFSFALSLCSSFSRFLPCRKSKIQVIFKKKHKLHGCIALCIVCKKIKVLCATPCTQVLWVFSICNIRTYQEGNEWTASFWSLLQISPLLISCSPLVFYCLPCLCWRSRSPCSSESWRSFSPWRLSPPSLYDPPLPHS